MSRNLGRVVLLAAVAAVLGGLGGCAKEKESCNASTTCSQSVQTCCTSSACHYTVAGRTFNCNGTNCDSAAVQAVNAACGRGADPGGAATQSLLREAALAAQAASQVDP
jgi:hypothetical protein